MASNKPQTELQDDEGLESVIRPGLANLDDELDTSNDDFGNEVTPSEPEPTQDDSATDDSTGSGDDTSAPEGTESGDQDESETGDGGDGSDTDAGEGDGQDEGDDDQDTPEPRIPKSRFDQVNERRKKAEQRLQELEKQQQASQPENAVDFDFDAKEQEYMDAILDGETEKALNIRKEIRAAEQAWQEAKLRETQQQATSATKQELELQQTIEELQNQYPVFDAQSESFDQDLTDEALELHNAFLERGYTPTDAMRRAVRYTVSVHGVQPSGASAQQPDPKPTNASSKKKAPARKQAQQPTEDQVREKLDTASQQPPDVPAGQTSVDNEPDVYSMSEEEFDRLSREEEARLRGDYG